MWNALSVMSHVDIIDQPSNKNPAYLREDS